MKTYAIICLCLFVSLTGCTVVRLGEVGLKRTLGKIRPQPLTVSGDALPAMARSGIPHCGSLRGYQPQPAAGLVFGCGFDRSGVR
ncbi:MAG: hypothetical protein ICV83_08585 [Cytophagales bacterium]|nr:hypothetical protein [Cytophagales bacterium]